MAKKSKAALAAMGKKITSLAKKIRKPNEKWQTAMKRAGKQLKGKL
jgi:hypothetical protein